MYILIDTDREEVIYRCEKIQSLRALAHIEFAHHGVLLTEETALLDLKLSINFLQHLFLGLTGGVASHSTNIEYITNQIIRLCQTAEETKIDAFHATTQSLRIKDSDKGFYQYAAEVISAKKLVEPYHHPALRGNWEAAQKLPLPTVQTAQHAPAQPLQHAQPWAVAPSTTPPKYAPPWA